MRFFFSTLRSKLISLYAVIIGTIALFIYVFFPQQLERQSLRAINAKANSIAVMAAYSLGPALYVNDTENAAEALKVAQQNRDLVFCVVEDARTNIFTAFNFDTAQRIRYKNISHDTLLTEQQVVLEIEPISFNNRLLGRVVVALSLSDLQKDISRARSTIALVSLFVFLFGVGTLYVISTLLTQPLNRIVSLFEKIASGNFSQRAPVTSRDEIGHLSASFNIMADKVEHAQRDLQTANTLLEQRVRERTEELRISEERYRMMVEYSPDAIGVHSEGKLVYVNPAAVKLFKAHSASQLLGRSVIDLVHPEYRDIVQKRFQEMMTENKVAPSIIEKLFCIDGSSIDVEVSALPFIYDNKLSIQVVVRDIGERIRSEQERKQLEEQLISAQKMESIGTLAGGIAHDFNNILAIISGYSEIIQKLAAPVHTTIVQHTESIRTVAERGAGLVRQLLTFAKKTSTKTDVVDVNAFINELVEMLTQTFPRIITIQTKLDSELPLLSVDQNQLYQALLNLCVNARDAIVLRNETTPGKNIITITTSVTDGRSLMRKHPQAEDVPYIIISVTDTGLGIEEDKLKRIFEPFYTTKDIGRGSGLGLAVVYGIVNAHKGYIEVASIVGGGTTFGLYFPAIEGTMHPDPPPVVAEDPNISGSELIFIIEDETMLLNIVRTHVESFGYRVLVAQDGEEALKIFKEQHENIDVVLSDLGLPKIDGMQLFREFKKLQPDIPFIVASGFFDAKMHSQLEEGGVSAIITKPYEMEKLLRTIRSVLRS